MGDRGDGVTRNLITQLQVAESECDRLKRLVSEAIDIIGGVLDGDDVTVQAGIWLAEADKPRT